MTIALMIEPEDQTVDPGREAVFTIHVVNQSGVVDRVALDILGSAGGWSVTEPQAVALFPGTDATARVVITPPLGTPLGPVPLGIRATAETSGFVEVGEANLNVGASRTVEAELRPRTATGKRRATSVVVLHNLGNAPTKVQVVATDPDDAIVFDAPSALQIGPGQTAELPLRMRLPSREKQGATLPYQVLVEGGETGQSLDGQVRQPAKKKWPLVAAMMALALLVMAILFLRPVDSVAIKDGAADEPTTSTLPGAVTTLPVATTVGGAAPADPVAAAAAAAAGAAGAAGGPAAAGPAGPAAAAPNPGGAPSTTLGPAGAPNIIRATTTTVPFPCPAKGSARATAERVVCAWGIDRLSDVGGPSITTPAFTKLKGFTPLVKGQTITSDSPVGADTLVSFACTPAGTGVASVTVSGTTGQVVDATRCGAVSTA